MASILVVDDERDVVTLIKFLLQKDGYTVVEAFNGAQALEKLGVDPPSDSTPLPDLVLLDVMMPIVDGVTVCERAGKNPRTSGVPIVVLTAKGQMHEAFKGAPNVAGHLEKPFDPLHLRELVKGLLGD